MKQPLGTLEKTYCILRTDRADQHICCLVHTLVVAVLIEAPLSTLDLQRIHRLAPRKSSHCQRPLLSSSVPVSVQTTKLVKAWIQGQISTFSESSGEAGFAPFLRGAVLIALSSSDLICCYALLRISSFHGFSLWIARISPQGSRRYSCCTAGEQKHEIEFHQRHLIWHAGVKVPTPFNDCPTMAT